MLCANGIFSFFNKSVININNFKAKSGFRTIFPMTNLDFNSSELKLLYTSYVTFCKYSIFLFNTNISKYRNITAL